MRSRRRIWPVGIFAIWSVLIWASRIRNIVEDDTLDGAAKAGSTAIAISFVVLGGAVLYAWARRTSWLRLTTTVAAAWTCALWVYRSVAIWIHEHGVAFKVVHTVLALVSVALAVAAVNYVRRPAALGDDADVEARPPVTTA